MHVNADFSRRAIVMPEQYRWVASPQEGVERVMLDRLGDESARATSLVRYAPGASFPRHPHPGGEEIFVLSGTFSEGDEHCAAGWYMRNPPGSIHRPSSYEGTTIFVKLGQMLPGESRRVRIDSNDPARWTTRAGRASCLLFVDHAEHVSLERLTAAAPLFDVLTRSAEILVLDGALREGAHSYGRGSWLRLPPGDTPEFIAGAEGATVYLKTGHLDDLNAIGIATC